MKPRVLFVEDEKDLAEEVINCLKQEGFVISHAVRAAEALTKASIQVFNCIILDCARVTFGDNVFLAPNVQLYTAYHPVIAAERIKGPEYAAPITIGNNVWLGGGVIVCPGVTIGDNTTIGAGSVVTKGIPANVVAAGNPCRVIREL